MINGLDRKLVLALQQNGRASHVELATQLGVHVSTVAKKMEASGSERDHENQGAAQSL